MRQDKHTNFGVKFPPLFLQWSIIEPQFLYLIEGKLAAFNESKKAVVTIVNGH